MTTPAEQARPAETPAAVLDRAEEAWRSRYADIPRMRSLVAELPDGPHRRVLDGFSAWREQRPDESIRLTAGLGEDPALCPVWRSRVLSVRAGLLSDLGLVRESFGVRQRAHEQALAGRDVVEEIACLHGFAVLYEQSDAERAVETYLETVRRIRAALADGTGHRVELESLKAIAVINLRTAADHHGLDVPDWVPTPADLLVSVAPHWPEMAGTIAAVLANEALAHGDLVEAQRLAALTPDPRTMRDVVISPSVSVARGRLLAATGRTEEAVAMLEAEATRLPPRHVPEILQAIMELHEQAGDVAAGLTSAKRLITATQRLHNSAASTALRALEVLFRTESAEAAARQARLEATTARQASSTDELTGLSNRRHLLTTGPAAMESPDAALGVVDLDVFKQINDTFGHAAGDVALRRVADALQTLARPGDVVARMGGDEFVVVRPLGGSASLAADLAHVTTLTCELPGAAGRVELRTSVGVAAGGNGWDVAYGRADRAMYLAKAAGGGTVRHLVGTDLGADAVVGSPTEPPAAASVDGLDSPAA